MQFSLRKEIPDHPAMAAHPAAAGLLQAATLKYPLMVSLRCCAEPDCDCLDVEFTLREVDSTGQLRPMGPAARAWIDPETGQLRSDGEPGAAQRMLLHEAANAIPADTLLLFATNNLVGKQAKRRLATAAIPVQKLRDKTIVSWLDLATGGRSLHSGGSALCGSVRHEGRTWWFDLLYCANPDCDCDKFHVEGYEMRQPTEGDDTAVLAQSFMVDGSLARDGLTVGWRSDNCDADVVEVVRAWLAEEPDQRAMIAQQSREVKAIGERSLQQAEALQAATGRRHATSRNQACPCGSGKKYKRCCLQKAGKKRTERA